MPAGGRDHPLPAGSQSHGAWGLARKPFEARGFRLGGCSAAPHGTDPVTTPRGRLEIEGGHGVVHLLLQDLDRYGHLVATHGGRAGGLARTSN